MNPNPRTFLLEEMATAPDSETFFLAFKALQRLSELAQQEQKLAQYRAMQQDPRIQGVRMSQVPTGFPPQGPQSFRPEDIAPDYDQQFPWERGPQ